MKRPVPLTSLAAAVALTAGIAHATPGETAYPDSFGNLVIQSASGHKRVIIGMGYVAADAGTHQSGEPQVLKFDDQPASASAWRDVKPVYRCKGGATVVRGRGYMYGLSRDEVAVITNVCD